MFPTLPAPRQSRQAEPLSHARLLNICYAYKRLREHVTGLQKQINEAVDEFQHSTRSRDSLDRFITRIAGIDSNISASLHEDILNVELETIRWEQRAPQLRSEAKRQARRRAERRERGDTAIGQAYLGGTNAEDDFDGATPSATSAAPETGPALSPTMAIALRGMKTLPTELPEALEPAKAPDTSGYRKSGLV